MAKMNEQYGFVLSEDGDRAFVNVMAFRRLNESSINRIKEHLKTGFMTLSAQRTTDKDGNAVTEKENFNNTKKLESLIREAKLGYIRLVGGWKDPNQPEQKPSYEQSFFIPFREGEYTEEEFEGLAERWADKFEQYSYLISLPSDKGKVRHMANPNLEKPYKKEDTFNAMKLNSEDTFFSFLKKGRDRGIRKGELRTEKKWSYISEEPADCTDIFVGYRIPIDSLSGMHMRNDPYEMYLWNQSRSDLV